MVEGGGFEPPKLARQIYSLIPLATREPLRKGAHSRDVNSQCQPSCDLKIPIACSLSKHKHKRQVIFEHKRRGRWRLFASKHGNNHKKVYLITGDDGLFC